MTPVWHIFSKGMAYISSTGGKSIHQLSTIDMNHDPHPHYNVAPRYTAGSPGLVDKATAEHVAKQERAGYENARKGRYGPELQDKALLRGLAGIVEYRIECPTGWGIHDLITGDEFLRPFIKKS